MVEVTPTYTSEFASETGGKGETETSELDDEED